MKKYFIAVCVFLVMAFMVFSIVKRYGTIDDVQTAIKHALPKKENSWGGNGITTALHQAAFNKSFEEIEQLLQLGANLDAFDENGQTPMHIAAYFGRLDVVKLMMEYGADPDAEDNLGWRPFNMVIEKPENEDLLDYLEEITTPKKPIEIIIE